MNLDSLCILNFHIHIETRKSYRESVISQLILFSFKISVHVKY